MPSVQLSTQIEKSVKDDLLEVCRRTHCSQSYYTEKALAAYLAWEKEYIRQVQEGIEAANRGEMIDDEEIDEWLSSWDTENELDPPEALMNQPLWTESP